MKISLSACSEFDYFLTTRRMKIPIPARAGRAEKARFYAGFCTRVYRFGLLDVQGVSGSSPLAPTSSSVTLHPVRAPALVGARSFFAREQAASFKHGKAKEVLGILQFLGIFSLIVEA